MGITQLHLLERSTGFRCKMSRVLTRVAPPANALKTIYSKAFCLKQKSVFLILWHAHYFPSAMFVIVSWRTLGMADLGNGGP
jgi:hypothetical protein